MNQLVAEILISCIILSLLVCCIPLYHNSMEMLGDTAARYLAEDSFPIIIPDSQSYGADVISLIDYYAGNPEVTVEIDSSYGLKSYVDTKYQEAPYVYPFTLDQLFLMDVTYTDKRVSSIRFTLQED